MTVLSNKGGCAAARTAEAKALGIKMGAPERPLAMMVSVGHYHIAGSWHGASISAEYQAFVVAADHCM